MLYICMPTVLTVGKVRVVIYTNDHPPPHVHAVRGNEARAKFNLNGPDGPVELVEQEGFSRSDISHIGQAIAEALTDICKRWSDIHG